MEKKWKINFQNNIKNNLKLINNALQYIHKNQIVILDHSTVIDNIFKTIPKARCYQMMNNKT